MNKNFSKLALKISSQFGIRKKKWQYYHLFQKTQYYNQNELAEFQNKRLNKLLMDVGNNVPYYKSLFELNNIDPELITVDNINQIPFLTKNIIHENKDSLLNPKVDKKRIIENSTSGSSGKKTLFCSDASSFAVKAPLNWRSLEWVGIEPGDKELRIWGAMHDVKKGRQIYNQIKSWLNNYRIISSYKLNDKIIKEFVNYINNYKPDQIHAYPSSLYEFAKKIIQNEYKVYKPKAVITSGEQLYEWQRKKIFEAFGADVFSFYGCREVNITAQECPEHKGLHIMAENIILEVVNEKGENVFDEEGEIVVTDLSNYVFPFIRYKILDRGILTREKCSCGRTLPLLKAINGRTFDIIKLKNGTSIGATFFTHLFREKPGIDDFRVYQNNIDEITVEYITSNPILDINFFDNRIKEHSENLLEVKFNEVKQFNIPDSGKKQFIFSKI